jgi:hypothetical protein
MRRPRRSLALLATTGLVFSAMAALSSTPATANHIRCGTVITQSTTLDADVGPCNTGHGLIVTGSNITLNLNGHRVFSDAPLPRMTATGDPANPFAPAEVVGILLSRVTGVTVTNGTVHGFSAGVIIDFGGSNRITNITARDNQGACIGEDFTTQAVGNYGDGIALFSSTNNRIENNQVLRNGPFSGVSIVANTLLINRLVGPAPTGNVVRGNNIDQNTGCFADIGVRVEGPAASNNVVTGNRVSRSFQEGISINSVNNIDIRGLIASPPTCQLRGFAGFPPTPAPNLPECPGYSGAQMSIPNSNNLIVGNQVTGNGFGGAQNAPRGNVQPTSLQAAAGIGAISFCLGSPTLGAHAVHGTGNVIQGNASIGNAGSGIWVGGCPAGPQFAPTVGYTNTQIINNLAVRNNSRGCGLGLPPPPGCGARPNTPNFDLLDSSGVVTCPSTTPAVQSICAGQGFGAPPGGSTPFVGTRVVVPGNQACDNNVWFGNVYATAFPPCTTNGGRQIGTGSPAPTAREFLLSGTAAEDPPSTGTAPLVSTRAAAMVERGHRAP